MTTGNNKPKPLDKMDIIDMSYEVEGDKHRIEREYVKAIDIDNIKSALEWAKKDIANELHVETDGIPLDLFEEMIFIILKKSFKPIYEEEE